MSTTIDIAALKKLKDLIGGETEDLAELVEDFIESFPEQVSRMRAECIAQDWPALRISAHTCKSNARDVGATILFQLCAALEFACETGAPNAPEDAISEIDATGAASITALKEVDLADV